MISIEISNLKEFMNKLLKQDVFNKFEVHTIELLLNYQVTIDGLINMDSFDEVEALKLQSQKYITWAEIKDNVFAFIKGNKSPTTLKIIFLLSKENSTSLIEKSNSTIKEDDISGFILNIIYDKNVLKIITATNYKNFTLDKSAEKFFDESIIKFLNKNNIQ